MKNKDMGFGKCECGKYATVMLNGVARCLSCFESSMKTVGQAVKAGFKLVEQP